MRRVLAVCLALSLTWPPAAASAGQDPPASTRGQNPPPAAAPPEPDLPSVESLGVSFDRIKRQLGERPPSSGATPLKLEYYVEVVGIAPPVPLFTPQELAAGPVPGAPPTHWEMVHELWTRPEFRAPAVPISSLAILGIAKLIEWQAREARKRRAEEERRLRDEELKRKYPDLVIKDR